ncbi:30S ribosomal protein S4 [Candidatus Woesearchaeota archaeon]|jgi:small subunit ribosomal protein S4|nr:30S ribosomal protein S4 [Candidatus Woesearchaeota archaeon]MBT5396996.1 30S ribosomal protein S4 [Candidatus Woesearchaeota archaeon]MBT5924975.1 30S ribosomal protein S4 [Candidatus Woesearchaeota archaeon]MBT6367458.1 30S ribosomal protein S4 [Candidatus Woesearchaeota archaeon]MBT7762396.1 30S ribosomal protein S4 [Candidatus Woesearchaeota archaeon]
MGDPKKLRKKYETPIHPWIKKNIDEDKILRRDYGLRNKRELLKISSFLKKYKNIAKRLTTDKSAQGEHEKKQVLGKLQKLGLLPVGSELDQILSLDIKHVLDRRLQSVLFQKHLARSMKQARQFITHRHVSIGDKEITAPSYLVTLEEEAILRFKTSSELADENHPERAHEIKEIQKEKEMITNSTEEKPAEDTTNETTGTK